MTTMDEVAASHRTVAGHFTELVAGVRDWDVPTPVTEWKARDIVDHLCTWVPGFMQGGTGITLPSGPSAQDDPVAAWAHLRDGMQAVMEDPANADAQYESSMVGTQPLVDVLRNFYIADVFMHSWDLARATGQDDTLHEPTVAAMYEGMSQIEDMLRASGQFGSRQPVADDAGVQDRFIAFIGRDPYWQPPA